MDIRINVLNLPLHSTCCSTDHTRSIICLCHHQPVSVHLILCWTNDTQLLQSTLELVSVVLPPSICLKLKNLSCNVLASSMLRSTTTNWQWVETSVLSAACTAMNSVFFISFIMRPWITSSMQSRSSFWMRLDIPLHTVASPDVLSLGYPMMILNPLSGRGYQYRKTLRARDRVCVHMCVACVAIVFKLHGHHTETRHLEYSAVAFCLWLRLHQILEILEQY